METTAESMISETCSWQEGFLERLQDFQHGFVAKGDAWLDYIASMDLTSKTSSKDLTWSDEWNQFTAFSDWPEWEQYRQVFWRAVLDGWQGIQSVFLWVWVSLQPVVYSTAYLGFRFLQATVGAFLPYLQRAFVSICRFHLHLTWQALLGEIAIICALIAIRKIYRWCKTQQYTTRARRYVNNKWMKTKRSIQSAYIEIAQVSLLLAMTIPHAAYIGIVVALKIFYPSWVTKVSTETIAPSLFKFWYPVIATIVVLHHSRAFVENSAKSKTKITVDSNKSTAKKKNKRRRSSIGALLHGTAPGLLPEQVGGNEQVVYTEEELTEDVVYWLNYWLLYSSLKLVYAFAARAYFVGSFITGETMYSVLCQLEFLFYIWIFCLPQCLLVLFPSAGDEERRDWSKSKQWCYKCAHNPVLAIPSLFTSVVKKVFTKVSHAVGAQEWEAYVVDSLKKPLQVASFMKMLSQERVEAIIDHLTNFRPLIVPAITLAMPGFATAYGVLYIQFIVPQAHSFEALEPKTRHNRNKQRILYLKFWVIHAFASVLMNWAQTLFWIVPLKMHMTFILWCFLVMPRMISSIYDEFDRELQAFRLLPPVADGLTVENTYTARSLSIIYNALPKAADVDGNQETRLLTNGNGGDADPNTRDKSASGKDDGKLDARKDNDDKNDSNGGNEGVATLDGTSKKDEATTEADGKFVQSDETKENDEVAAITNVLSDDGEKENSVLPAGSKKPKLVKEAPEAEDAQPSSSKGKKGQSSEVTDESLRRRRRSNRLKQPTI